MSDLADGLRERLGPPQPDPELLPGVPSAVLVPILDLDDPSLLFTVRTQEVRHHKGEVSFPGGVRHAEDPDLLATALRETEEETGIPPHAVEVLGVLPPIDTFVSGYVIAPFVGRLQSRPRIEASPIEVAEVLEIPLADLASAEREGLPAFIDPGRTEGPERPYPMYVYEVGGHTVWGATGRIVHALLQAAGER